MCFAFGAERQGKGKDADQEHPRCAACDGGNEFVPGMLTLEVMQSLLSAPF